jgi:hypothetical protein
LLQIKQLSKERNTSKEIVLVIIKQKNEELTERKGGRKNKGSDFS